MFKDTQMTTSDSAKFIPQRCLATLTKPFASFNYSFKKISLAVNLSHKIFC